jgi:hypothetical protein
MVAIVAVFTVAVSFAVVALLFSPQGLSLYRLAIVTLGGLFGAIVFGLLVAFLWAGLTAQQPRHRNSRATATARHRSAARLPSHTSRGSRFLSDRQRRGYFFLQRARP